MSNHVLPGNLEEICFRLDTLEGGHGLAQRFREQVTFMQAVLPVAVGEDTNAERYLNLLEYYTSFYWDHPMQKFSADAVSSNPFYIPFLERLAQIEPEDVADLMRKGYMQLMMQAYLHPFKTYDPVSHLEEWVVMGPNQSWYASTHERTMDEFVHKLTKRDSQMSKVADEAIWGIKLHHIEVKLLESKMRWVLDQSETRLGLLHPEEIVDLGTGEEPSKLYPIIDATLSKYAYSRGNPLRVYLVDCNPVSLEKAQEKLEGRYRKRPVEFRSISHTFEYQQNEDWPELRATPDRRLVVMSGNTIWNVQEDPLYYFRNLPEGVSIITSHLLPMEDYAAFTTFGTRTDLIGRLGESYSTRSVQEMGTGVMKAAFKLGREVFDMSTGSCLPEDTMSIYLDQMYHQRLVSSIPTFNIDVTNPPPEIGGPLLLADTGFNYRLGILNSLKPTKAQVDAYLELMGIGGAISAFSDPFRNGSNYLYPAGLVGLYAFRTRDIKVSRSIGEDLLTW